MCRGNDSLAAYDSALFGVYMKETHQKLVRSILVNVEDNSKKSQRAALEN